LSSCDDLCLSHSVLVQSLACISCYNSCICAFTTLFVILTHCRIWCLSLVYPSVPLKSGNRTLGDLCLHSHSTLTSVHCVSGDAASYRIRAILACSAVLSRDCLFIFGESSTLARSYHSLYAVSVRSSHHGFGWLWLLEMWYILTFQSSCLLLLSDYITIYLWLK
jgi:hypothetical protein